MSRITVSHILKFVDVNRIVDETRGSRSMIGEIDYANDEVFKEYCMDFEQNCCCIIFNKHPVVTEEEHNKYKTSQSFWDENGRKKLQSYTNKFKPKQFTWTNRKAQVFEKTIITDTKNRSGFGLRDVDFCTYNKDTNTLYTISFIDAIEGYEVKEWGGGFKLNKDYLHLIEDDRIASQIDGYDILDVKGGKLERKVSDVSFRQREIDRKSFYNIFKGAAIGFGLNGKRRKSLEPHNRINLPSMFYNNDGQPEWLAKERRTFGVTNCKYIVWKKKTVKEGTSSARNWVAPSSDDDDEEEKEEEQLITTNIVINDFNRVPTLPKNAVPGDVKNSDHFLNFLSLMERFVAPMGKTLYMAVHEAYIELVDSINEEVLHDLNEEKAIILWEARKSPEDRLKFKIQQYKNLPTNPDSVQSGIENQAKHILDVVIWSALLMNINGKQYIKTVDYEDPSYFYEMLSRVNRTMKQSDLVVQFIHMIFHYDLDAITKVKLGQTNDKRSSVYYPTFPLNIFLMKDLFKNNNGMYLNSTKKNNFLKGREKNINFDRPKKAIQVTENKKRAQVKNYGFYLFFTEHKKVNLLIKKFFGNMSDKMQDKLADLVTFYYQFISSLMFTEGDSSYAKITYFLNGGQGALKKAQGIRAYLRNNSDIQFPDDDNNTLKQRFQSTLDDIIDQLNSIRQYISNYSGEDEETWISTEKFSREDLKQYYDEKISDLEKDLNQTKRNPLEKIEMEYSLQLYHKTLTYFSNIDKMVERDETIAEDTEEFGNMKSIIEKKTGLKTATTLSNNIEKLKEEGRKLKINIKQIKKSQGKKKEEEKQKEAELKEVALEELEGLTTELNNKYGLNLGDQSVSNIIEHCRRMIDVVKEATKISNLRDEIKNRLYEMTSRPQFEKDQRDRVKILKRLEKEYKRYSDALNRLQSSNSTGIADTIKFKPRKRAKFIRLRSELENVEDRKYQVSKLFDRYNTIVETLSLYTQTLSAAIEYRKIEVNEQMKKAEKELDAIYKFLQQTMKQKKYFNGPISGLEIISRLKKLNGEKLYLDYLKDNSLSLESRKLNMEKTKTFQQYDNMLNNRRQIERKEAYLKKKNKLEKDYEIVRNEIEQLINENSLTNQEGEADAEEGLLQNLLKRNVRQIKKKYKGITKATYIKELLDREEENKKEKRKEFDYDDNNNNIPRKKKRDKLIDEYEQLKF